MEKGRNEEILGESTVDTGPDKDCQDTLKKRAKRTRDFERLLDNKGWNATWNVNREPSGLIKLDKLSINVLTELVGRTRSEAAMLLELAGRCEEHLKDVIP